MQLLKNVSIPWKLKAVILCTTIVALLVTCVALFTFERLAFQSGLEQNLSTLAQVIGDNCATSVALDQPDDTKELLSALDAEPQIEAAWIYSKTGEAFGSYASRDTSPRPPAARPLDGFHWEEQYLLYAGSLSDKKSNQRVGTICLLANFSAMRQRFRLYAQVIGGVLLVSVLVAYSLSGPLQRIISKPILDLAQTAQSISIHKDYSVRAQKVGEDEIGAFTDAFNLMLIQIEQQDQALRLAKDELEGRVADRTRELRELQRQKELILNSAGEGIYGLDLAGRMTFVNATAAQMIGSHVDELGGRDEHAVVRHSNAEGQPYSPEHCPICAEFRLGKPYSSDDQILWRKGNATFHAAYIRTPLVAGDQIVGAVVVFRDITEQKAADQRLAALNKQLQEASRQAGQAEVATAVLHNLGNVLNSVNVSALLLNDYLRHLRTRSLAKVVELVREHAGDLGRFMTQDPKGKALPDYLASLALHWDEQKIAMGRELDILTKHVDHIKEIVTVQQAYAKVSGIVETLPVASLVEDALQVSGCAFSQHDVQLIREYAEVPSVQIDKHKSLQILINLLRNALDALESSPRPNRKLTLKIGLSGAERVKIEVADNGVGIAPENLTRIYSHGFTTKANGHGFGLHSGALAAKEMGGALTVRSAGPGLGATFTLELPLAKKRTHT